MKSFTALTPFWRGKINSFSDNPPLELTGVSLFREILYHELSIFYHREMLFLLLTSLPPSLELSLGSLIT